MLRARAITLLVLIGFLTQSILSPLVEADARSISSSPPEAQPPKSAPVHPLRQPSQRELTLVATKAQPVAAIAPASASGLVPIQIPFTAAPTDDLPAKISQTLGGCNPVQGQGACQEGDPVNVITGNFWHTVTDLTVPGRGPALHFERTYNSTGASGGPRPLGSGWTHNYNMFITETCDNVGCGFGHYYQVHQENGSTAIFAYGTQTGAFPPLEGAKATLISDTNGSMIFTRNQGQERFIFHHCCEATGDPLTGMLEKVIDRNNYTTTLAYDPSSHLLSLVTDPAGRTLTFTNTNGLLTGIRDSAGRSVLFTYDQYNDLRTVTDVANQVSSYTYSSASDSLHNLLTMKDPAGGIVTNTYKVGTNKVAGQLDSLGRGVTFEYIGVEAGCNPLNQKNVTLVTDTLGLTRSYATNCSIRGEDFRITEITQNPNRADQAIWHRYYDDPNHKWEITRVQDPNGHTITQTLDTNGNVQSITDPLGRTTRFAYNATNDLLVMTDSLQVPITYTYDLNGNLLSAARPVTQTGPVLIATLGYDPAHPGDVLTITNPLGNAWRLGHDAAYGYVLTTTDPLTRTSRYAYDNLGRVLSVVNPRGYTTTLAYNAYGAPTRITDTLGYTTVYTYDANRNLQTVRNAKGYTTTFAYNADNELTRVTNADGTHSDYGYDLGGNLITQTNALTQTTLYAYDSFYHLQSVKDALNRETTYRHDAVGNLLVITDARGLTTTFGYDPADQLTSITYQDPSTTPNVAFSYDALGRRTVMTDGTGTTLYTYDWMNQPLSVQNGAGKTVKYGYDLAGNLTRLVYPSVGDTNVVTRTYNAANELTAVQDWLTHTSSFSYDPNGNLKGITYGNGVTATLGYDAADQILTMTHRLGSTVVFSQTYSHDPVGLLSAAVEPNGPGNNTDSYSYDPLNRLIGDGLSGGTTISRTWGYDGATQLVTTSYTAGGTPIQGVRTYDAANQLKSLLETQGATTTSDLSFGFDADGNRTSRFDKLTSGTTSYTYDGADRLHQINPTAPFGPLATYQYNGDGLRMHKEGTTGRSIYGSDYTWDVAAGMPLLVQDNSSNFIYGPGGQVLEQIDGSGTAYYYHADQLGSVRALTNQSGAVAATYAYDAYGNQTTTTGNVYNPLRYAGEYLDSESGFYYLRARYYDPSTQQFLTRDPLVAATEQAYTYANGSPLNYTDPTGQGPEILLLVVACPECAAVGAAGLLALWLLWNLQHNQQLQACFVQVGNQIGSNTWWSQTDDERALRELVDEVTNGGRKPLSREDAETILDWGDEIKYPGIRAKPGDVESPSNWKGHPDQPPHIHVPGAGRGGHVQVEPGVRPR